MTTFAGQWGPYPLQMPDAWGRPTVAVAFEVLLTGTSTVATTYADRLKNSPSTTRLLKTDQYGFAKFFADPGDAAYDIRSGGRIIVAGVTVEPDQADVGGTIPPGTYADAAATTAALAGKISAGLTFVVDDHGIVGNGSDITTGLGTLMATANAAAVAKGAFARATILFTNGVYGVQPNIAVPERVSFLGTGRGNVELRNLGTTYGNGLLFYGSGISCRGLTYNGQRSLQTGSVGGGAAITFTKPNGTGTNAGGLALSATVSVGATSFSVSSGTIGSGIPVLPRDMVSFYDGTNYETVRVADTYTPGASTIPVTSPFVYGFATSATVCVFSTDNVLADCTVKAIGFEGVENWHSFGCRVEGNTVRDAVDNGVGVSAMGTRELSIIGNDVETSGKWCAFIDGALSSVAGPTGHVSILNNRCRLIPGDVSGAFECIGVASGGAVEDVEIAGNHLDITRAGGAGISLRYDLSSRMNVHDNFVYCGGRAGTRGILRYANGSGDTTGYDVPRISHNTILSAAAVGIDLGDVIQATLVGNLIVMSTTGGNGLAVTTNNHAQQNIKTIGNIIRLANGASSAFLSVGSVPSQSPLWQSVGDTITGTYFLINGLQQTGTPWAFTSESSFVHTAGAETVAGVKTFSDNVIVGVVGKGLQVKEGSNAKQGTATLVAGTVTVSNTSVTSTSRIFLTVQSLGTVTVPKAIGVTARTAGASFTITSADGTDTSVIGFEIYEAAP